MATMSDATRFRQQRYRAVSDSLDETDSESSLMLSFEDCFEACASCPATACESPTPFRSCSPAMMPNDTHSEPLGELHDNATPNAKPCSRLVSTNFSVGANNSPSSVIDAPATPRSTLDKQSAAGSDTTSTRLDFSFFDSCSPRSELDRNLAPAIAAVMNKRCPKPSSAVKRLVEMLFKARKKRMAGVTTCSEINAVMYNRLVPRLVELRKYKAAARVLDMMAGDNIRFTTLDDGWVLSGNLKAAVKILRRLVQQKTLPKPRTLNALFFGWLAMGSAGHQAAIAVNKLQCQLQTVISHDVAHKLVSAVLPRTPTVANVATLETILKNLLRSSTCTFESGAVACVVQELENRCSGDHRVPTSIRALVFKILTWSRERRPSSYDLRVEGSAFRVALGEGSLAKAVDILRHLHRGEADEPFLTSALHAVASTVASIVNGKVNVVETQFCIVDVAKELTSLAARCANINLPHTALNQALTVLRQCTSETTASSGSAPGSPLANPDLVKSVATAFFEGLHSLHGRAVNRRTFGRFFDILLTAPSGKTVHASDELLGAIKSLAQAAANFGYQPEQKVMAQLDALGCLHC